ncbi:MAG: ABC transporter ATP-binding protein [Acidimicrobiia bacterium]
MTSPVVELVGVGREYATEPPVHALIDVDLCIDPGEWLAVAGPSGSGKSTLLNVLGLLDRPTSGEYRLDGIDVAERSEAERAGLRGERIGFVFQSFHLLAHRSALENVMMTGLYQAVSRSERETQAREALELVGLGHRVDFLPTRLSGGERQRVAIARAIASAPSLLLADEPTGNLDSANTVAILDLFATLHKRGLTIVMITHDADVSSAAQRRVGIVDGRLTEVR